MKSAYILSIRPPSLEYQLATPYWTDALQFCEEELARHGIPLVPNMGPQAISARSLARDSKAVGFVIHDYTPQWAISEATNQAGVEREMEASSKLKLPVVVLNPGRVLDRFPDFTFEPYRNVFPISADNRQAGRKVGLFLANKGHRCIAFLSYSSDRWNTLRREGLALAKKSSFGMLEKVIPFEANFKVGAYISVRDVDRGTLNNEIINSVKTISPPYVGRRKKKFPEVLGSLMELANLEKMENVMKPLLEDALSDSSITAWVASDPFVALTATRFLRERKVRYPADISVISIDDHKDLAVERITICHIESEGKRGAGYLAARCLLGDPRIEKGRKGLVNLPTMMIDRGSVAEV